MEMPKALERRRDEYVETECDFCKREERNVTDKNGKLGGIQAYEWECREAMKQGFNACWEELAPVVEALRATVKENTIILDPYCCKKDGHDWEPDTSMTIMRCERCGIGANTDKARQALSKLDAVGYKE